jgi:hypothetical protein
METENTVVDMSIDDDAALDAQLQSQLDSINNKPAAEPSAPPAEAKPAASQPQVEAGAKDTSSPVSTNEAKAEGSQYQEGDKYDFRAPIRGSDESEDSYQVRLEIAEKIRERNLATTEADKANIQNELRELRNELKQIGSSEKFIKSQHNQTNDAPSDGNDVLAQARQLVQQEFAAREVTSTLNGFVSKHNELQDPATRDVFFEFVESNFNWQGKTGQDLQKVLDMAHQTMFRRSNNVQERVLKSANVQEKVNAMQFPGGSAGRPGLSPEVQSSIDELKAQGMTEQQALDLIS